MQFGTARQPVRFKTVTHVLGIKCYLSLKKDITYLSGRTSLDYLVDARAVVWELSGQFWFWSALGVVKCTFAQRVSLNNSELRAMTFTSMQNFANIAPSPMLWFWMIDNESTKNGFACANPLHLIVLLGHSHFSLSFCMIPSAYRF